MNKIPTQSNIKLIELHLLKKLRGMFVGRKSTRILCIATRQHAIDFLTTIEKPISPKEYESVLNKQVYSKFRNKKERSRLGDNHIHGKTNCSPAIVKECRAIAEKRSKWLDNTITREFYLAMSSLEELKHPEEVLFTLSHVGRMAVIGLCFSIPNKSANLPNHLIRLSKNVLADELFATLIVSCCWLKKLTGKATRLNEDIFNAIAAFALLQSKLHLVRKELNAYFCSLFNDSHYLKLVSKRADALNQAFVFGNTFETGNCVKDVIFCTRLSQLENVTPSLRREFILRFLLADFDLLNDNFNYIEGNSKAEWLSGERGFHFVYSALSIPFRKITDTNPLHYPSEIIRNRAVPSA